jgi:hypothetical protein
VTSMATLNGGQFSGRFFKTREKEVWDRDRVCWCAWNLSPESVLRFAGFQRVTGRLNPRVRSRQLSAPKFDADLFEDFNS